MMNTPEEKKPYTIRAGRASDVPGITDLYNDYVENTIVTFDIDRQSVEDRMEWFSAFSETGSHRLLVAEEAGVIVGYTTSSFLRPRVAYKTSVESAVYVRRDYIGSGLGKALYTELFAILANENVHRVYAALAVPNPESVRLHEKFEYKHVGTFHEVGFKFGRYLDVAWYEKAL